MNISRKPRFTRRHIGQAIISSVAIAASAGILSLAGLGLPDTAAAQPAPAEPAPAAPPAPPAPPAGAGATPITIGQTINGSLASTDPVDRQGRPRDHYRLINRTPNARFVITLTSPTIPVRSRLAFRNVAVRGDPLVSLAEARTFEGGQQIQYSGTLEKRGEYQIEVSSAETQRPNGNYTISLGSSIPAAGAAGAGG